MEKEKEAAFQYTYSASGQEEVKRIRQKYLPPAENKMEQLRRLDESVTRRGTVLAIALGTVSSLVFGWGLCCVLLWSALFAIGIFIGLVGLAGIACAYPLYRYVTRREQQKLAPQILALTEELLG